MRNVLIAGAALLVVGLAARPGQAFHPFHCFHHGHHHHYVKVPVFPGAPPAFGFSVGAPASFGYSFGVPMSYGYSVGVPSSFGLVPQGYGLGYGYGLSSYGLGAYSAGDAQGLLDQLLIPILLQQLRGGGGLLGGGGKVSLTDDQVKLLAEKIVTQSQFGAMSVKIDNIEKILRAMIREKKIDPKVPDAVPPVGALKPANDFVAAFGAPAAPAGQAQTANDFVKVFQTARTPALPVAPAPTAVAAR